LNYAIEWRFLFTITALAILGILIGHRFSGKVSAAQLRRSFGWFVLITGIYILVREVAAIL